MAASGVQTTGVSSESASRYDLDFPNGISPSRAPNSSMSEPPQRDPFPRHRPLFPNGSTPPRSSGSPPIPRQLEFSGSQISDPRVSGIGPSGETQGPHVVFCGSMPIYSTSIPLPPIGAQVPQNTFVTPAQPWQQPQRPVTQFLTPASAQEMLNHLGYGVIPDQNSLWTPITAQQQSQQSRQTFCQPQQVADIPVTYPQQNQSQQVAQYSTSNAPYLQPIYSAPVPYPTVPNQWHGQSLISGNNQAQSGWASQLMQTPSPSMVQLFSQPDFVQNMRQFFDTIAQPFELPTTFDKFPPHISSYPLPNAPKIPSTLGTYNGLTDPDDFLQRFEGAMRTQNWVDPVACQIFPMTLQGVAREWFNRLPAGSITGFIDLRTKFLMQYQNQRPRKRTHIECHDIAQKPKESLGEFLTRYTNECLRIPDLKPEQQISGLIHGINAERHPTLVKRLRRNVPLTYAEALKECHDYMRSYEDSEVPTANGQGDKKDDDSERSRDYNRGNNSKNRHSSGGPTRNDRGRNNGGGYRQNNQRGISNQNYALIKSLSKTPKEILATEPICATFAAPTPLSEFGKKDKSKYCEFHGEHGHDTNKCKNLMERVLEALRAGKLDHLRPPKKDKGASASTTPAKTYAWQKKPEKEKGADITINMVDTAKVGQRRKYEQPNSWEEIPVSFPSLKTLDMSSNPINITCRIPQHGITIKRMHVDTGSGVDIMYEHCFRHLPEEVKSKLEQSDITLSGFSGECSWPLGRIGLQIELSDNENPQISRVETINFYVVRSVSRYNALLGRAFLQTFGAIPSVVHGMIKVPTKDGIATMLSGEHVRVCSTVTPEEIPAVSEQVRSGLVVANPRYPDKKIRIGGTLSEGTKQRLHGILLANADVFAWQEADMTGVPREVAQHKLNVSPSLTPVRQKKRYMASDRSDWLCAEVDNLVKANILREARYQTWVANPVLVKKPDGNWRMCVDFKDINKACPKDNYPLPEIDWKVESLSGFRFKCFLDAYKGYHQILMAIEDEDKTAFHTPQGIFCYTKMPFGLKNAGATYQRVIDAAFKHQIGRNLEAYVDDLVIKSNTEEGMLQDVLETFASLRKINMKLNPLKCSFGEEEGKFLGHIVTERGIKANPKKIAAIENLPPPRTKKDVQSLTGKLAAITRFLSKAAERQLPFFNTLKNCLSKKDFVWTAEADKAFEEMKKVLAELPTLTAPIAGETLTLYLAASKEAISSVLIAERGKTQMPVYFVSKTLTGSEVNYSAIEKLVYALVHTARRLRRYFQAHPIVVLTDQPIRQVLYKPEVSGRMAKWAVELGEHEISFSGRSAVKGQVLADYLAELPADCEASAESNETPTPSQTPWELYTDGACSAEGAGAGVILNSPDGEEYTYALRFNFVVTNNEAEYEALLSGMRIAKELGVKDLHAFVDSQLVCSQINGTFEAHDMAMQMYLSLVQNLAEEFDLFQVSHVLRGQNKKADALSKLAALTFGHLGKKVLIEEIQHKSINMVPLIAPVAEENPNWMTPFIAFLKNGTLPSDAAEARKIRVKAPMYVLEGETLYRRNYLGPQLRCVGPSEAEQVIREVHEGACALHSGHRMIAAKIMRLGYYRPTLYADTADIVKRCESCQIHAPISRAPAHPMIPVSSPWPFCKWAIDIVGPFPKGKGNIKFLVVDIDYFTKWVEAKALATITGNKIRNFVWEDIVCRFGIPNEIVSDNGTQFAGNPFRAWCEELNIKQTFTSVAHPQANGQCEVTNRDIVAGIKSRLGYGRTGWVDELPKVLWAHRTTPKDSTGETPFSLVYGSEAVVPTEIGTPTHRITHFDEETNSDLLRENLNFIEERRIAAAVREANNKQKIAKYYNKRVRPNSFSVNDLVWRRNDASHAEDTGKLGPRWGGPYKVVGTSNTGAYRLETLCGKSIPRTWHATLLKRCYI